LLISDINYRSRLIPFIKITVSILNKGCGEKFTKDYLAKFVAVVATIVDCRQAHLKGRQDMG